MLDKGIAQIESEAQAFKLLPLAQQVLLRKQCRSDHDPSKPHEYKKSTNLDHYLEQEYLEERFQQIKKETPQIPPIEAS